MYLDKPSRVDPAKFCVRARDGSDMLPVGMVGLLVAVDDPERKAGGPRNWEHLLCAVFL